MAAVLPGTESYKSRVNLNDWLMRVNDLEVSWDNLDSILSAVTTPKQVRTDSVLRLCNIYIQVAVEM